ncbi:metalloregulator ArsR/SmtB family transcription factor [soil metagenome]
MPTAEVFKALGDPIRLQMVQRLSGGSSYTITSVSTELGVTRQGARKHLNILEHAKLVVLEPRGRDVLVTLEPATLDTAKAFITTLEKQWVKRLDGLKEFVEKEHKKSS